jgi:nitrate reductase (NAD(P)H)
MRGKFVEFIGVEDLPNKVGPGPFPDAPWGKLVKYGTSVPLARAMNPAYDILIAYEANGEKLQPDHGFPIRLIIPGYIGGRMIKWLKHINVLNHDTTNHYHYHDNRILPPNITAEESSKDGWWYKPEYIFNELNINSVIARPDHNERISLQSLLLSGKNAKAATASKNISNNDQQFYCVGGYAYTGGGRMITRVEVSLDGGHQWQLATIDRKEKPTDYGMYWCWIWWNIPILTMDLLRSKEIWCRAWDESNNVQPNNPTWNLMGMGNNHTFRVKIHIDNDGYLRFEHPTQPGQVPGGWMTKTSGKPESAGFGKLQLNQGDATVAEVSPPPNSVSSAAADTKKDDERKKVSEIAAS